MELMSISEFARRSRLSPKALRLYDEMGLLPPDRVDAVTGYRFYEVEQIEPARLRAVMYGVDTREIPSRSLLCLKRNVEGWADAWAFGKEFVGGSSRAAPCRTRREERALSFPFTGAR
jgi:hypothetical protein